ncbi:MAG TPA: FtsX-like permease family protein [Sphingobium sp.]|nr:FtsX-like permease family protein [Sphingobium sp.]
MSRADRRAAAAARHRLLPEGRVAGPMPWVIAIMMFLTVLSAAAGLGLGAAVRAVGADLAGRATVQIVEANADLREALSGRAARLLRASPDVRAIHPVDPATLADQIRPWLGEDAASGDLPIPALIDVDLAPGAADARIARLRGQLAALSPRIRLEPHAAFLQPLGALLAALGGLAAGIVLLMGLATAAIVVLAARAAHDSHRGTIDVLHLMGATDVQIARLFQRRIGLDALFGGALGFAFALLVIILLGTRLAATGSDLLAAIRLPWTSWIILATLPVAGVLLATLAARWTVLRSLGRLL